MVAKAAGGMGKKMSAAMQSKRDKTARIVCVNCGSSSTPQWRMGPTGPKVCPPTFLPTSAYIFKIFQWIGYQIHWIRPEP